jgi:hypothetical protein
MGFTQSSQGSKDFAASPFGGLRGLPLPYFLFLLSYYLFFFATKARRHKEPQSLFQLIPRNNNLYL